MKKLSSLGEFGWLKRLLPKLYWPSTLYPQLCIRAGDDAGVVRITPGRVLVATTDAMVEGVHFERKWLPWDVLGEKVLSVNLSDLAAMGDVKPLAALVTAAFPPETSVVEVSRFYKGLKSCAQRWKTGLLGGDTVGSKRDWFISVTVFGEANPKSLIRREGAKPGDYLVTSGPLGLAGAGLEVVQAGKPKHWTRPLVQAFYHPKPRLAAGQLLGRERLASSLMDSSDGLAASVRILAEASKVGAEIFLPQIPVPPALAQWAKLKGRPPAHYALYGGEDYELIFTVRPSQWPLVKRRLPGSVQIGHILKEKGCWISSGRGRRPLKGYGFSHFDI